MVATRQWQGSRNGLLIAQYPGRHYDDTLAGFGLYVGAGGAKAYFLEYRAGYGRSGIKRRMTIGRHGAPWTPHVARTEAQRLLGLVRAGHDPLSERRATKTVTRLDAITAEWLAEVEAKRKPRTDMSTDAC